MKQCRRMLTMLLLLVLGVMTLGLIFVRRRWARVPALIVGILLTGMILDQAEALYWLLPRGSSIRQAVSQIFAPLEAQYWTSAGDATLTNEVVVNSEATLQSAIGGVDLLKAPDIGVTVQAFDADLADLADGSLTGTKVGFSDPNSNFAATDIQTALAELDNDNGVGPNQAAFKVHWSQIGGMPAGFADGTDDGAGGSLTEDSVGTLELDDGADTPASGEYVRVDTGDQAGFEYRTAAETRADIGANDAANLTTGEIHADRVGTGHIDAITEIASALRAGADGLLLTGTPGTSGNCPEWNADGDLVDSGAPCGSSGEDGNAIHDNVAAEIIAVSAKAVLLPADVLLCEDSADSFSKKSCTVESFETALEGLIDIVDLQGNLPASAITVTPAGGIAADDVQEALQELDTEKASLNANVSFGIITATELTLAPVPTPTLIWRDSNLEVAGDVNKIAATAFADCTNTGVGTADCDLTFSAQLDGTLTPFITFNANTGTTTILGLTGAGSGSLTTLKENGTQVGGADIVTLDFLGADFDLTETPDTEVNVAIAAALTRDVEWNTIGALETATSYDFSSASNLDTGTLPAARLGANSIDAITEIAAALRSGADGKLITGTAGTSGNCPEWNADGDLVDSGAPCGGSRWTDTGAVTYLTDTTDLLAIGATTPGNSAHVGIVAVDDRIQLNVRAFSTQTTALQHWETSVGAGIASVRSDGIRALSIQDITGPGTDWSIDTSGVALFQSIRDTTGPGTNWSIDASGNAAFAGFLDMAAGTFRPPRGTVAAMLAIASPQIGMLFEVTDGETPGDCTVGGETGTPFIHWCRYTGTDWEFFVGDVADFRTAIFGAEIDCSDTPGDVQVGIQEDGTPLCGAAPAGLWEAQSTVLLAPAGTHDAIRISTDADGPIIGKAASGSMGFDLDGDGDGTTDFEVTFTYSAPDVVMTLSGTNSIRRPNGAGGDLIDQESTADGGEACTTKDPTSGAITQGTNCQTLSYSHNVAVAGNLTGLVPPNLHTGASVSLTAAQMSGQIHYNNDADAINFELPSAVAGMWGCFMTFSAHAITLDPAAGDAFVFDGVARTTANACDLSATAGAYICLHAKDTTNWVVWGMSGTCPDGGAD